MTVGTSSDNRLEERMEQLLPGIPDELTLKEISTKLMWREFYVLACVSRDWRNAIRNREVYDERVRCGLTKTFIVIGYGDENHGWPRTRNLALCSLRDNSWRELPAVPHFDNKRPWSYCIVVDGKVYVLGDQWDNPGGPRGTVYMLDLGGQKPWTQCASIQIPRTNYGCGAMDGKIYVFGGASSREVFWVGEVFDPKENSWSLITPSRHWRFSPHVVGLGEELLVSGGGPQNIDSEIYNPVKDEWRTVCDPFRMPIMRRRTSVFVAKGKLHLINDKGIYVQNSDENSYTELHQNSFDGIEDAESQRFSPHSVLVLEDEIFAGGFLVDPLSNADGYYVKRDCLLRSTGFGSDKKELAWREEKDWPSKGCTRFSHDVQLFMHAIQL